MPHVGVHRSTNNLHLQVGYNLIRPERRTRHEPFRGFWIRDKLCRKLELKYGLTPDKGLQPDKSAGGSDLARTYEAHTGQESFFSYAQRQLADFGLALTHAKTWLEVHQVLARRGLKLQPRGNKAAALWPPRPAIFLDSGLALS
ncbi:MAG: relaxase/mobilization nuclease domain-containing protein [Candidatus Adiutrix sp.]|nr:relaxase/mobilization nuclease domain-containing protein [Candidatus Adiutrix sp.]